MYAQTAQVSSRSRLIGVRSQIGIPLTLVVLVIEGTLGGAILGPGVSKAGIIGAPEYATVAVCGAMTIPFFVLFLRTTIFDVWEARFWHMPWSDSAPVAPGEPCRKSAPFVGQPCPFTGVQTLVDIAHRHDSQS